MKPISILISSWHGGEAIELCIESLLARTSYPYWRIIVLDSSGEGSKDKVYLRGQRNFGNITLWEHESQLSHGEAIARLIKVCNTPLACILDSDVEILHKSWLNILVSPLKTEKDLGVAQLRPDGYFPESKTWRTPAYLPYCMILNITLYKFIQDDSDWPERYIKPEEYEHKNKFPVLGNKGIEAIHYDTAGMFTEKVLFRNNEHDFNVYNMPNDFWVYWINHHEGMSAHHNSSNEKVRERRQVVHKRLMELRGK